MTDETPRIEKQDEPEQAATPLPDDWWVDDFWADADRISASRGKAR